MQSASPPFYTNETNNFTGQLPPHVLFRKKANCIASGNVYSNVQCSSYIRPRQETECNSLSFPIGHLQARDLETLFGHTPELRAAREFIEKDPYFATNTAIAYRFFHFDGGKRVTHGVIITDANYHHLRRFDRVNLGLRYSAKSEAILSFCKQFVTVPGTPATMH